MEEGGKSMAQAPLEAKLDRIMALLEGKVAPSAQVSNEGKNSPLPEMAVSSYVKEITDLRTRLRETEKQLEMTRQFLLRKQVKAYEDGCNSPIKTPAAEGGTAPRLTRRGSVELLQMTSFREATPKMKTTNNFGKAMFRLLKADDQKCYYVCPDYRISHTTKSTNLVRLVWEERPKTVLIIKKPRDPEITKTMAEIAHWLHKKQKITVMVEPIVKEDPLLAKYTYLKTWKKKQHQHLNEIVDFVVCLGGDGTLLWLSNLFREAMPPIISFAMGSLGFLTPFPVSQYRHYLTQTIKGGFYLSLRSRLKASIERAPKRTNVFAFRRRSNHRRRFSDSDMPNVRRMLDEYGTDDDPYSTVPVSRFSSDPAEQTSPKKLMESKSPPPPSNRVSMPPLDLKSISEGPIRFEASTRNMDAGKSSVHRSSIGSTGRTRGGSKSPPRRSPRRSPRRATVATSSILTGISTPPTRRLTKEDVIASEPIKEEDEKTFNPVCSKMTSELNKVEEEKIDLLNGPQSMLVRQTSCPSVPAEKLRGKDTQESVKKDKSRTEASKLAQSPVKKHISFEFKKKKEFWTALNEVIVDNGKSTSLTNMDCYCDGVFTTKCQGDGLIIATPTGSTAYSLSAGGSMVHPQVPGILFTPVCPHSLSFRPIVFPDTSKLSIEISMDARADHSVAFDGRLRQTLGKGDKVVVSVSSWPVPAISRVSETDDWFTGVRSLLHWNVRTQQKKLLPGKSKEEE
mmetsp:Transcript_17108/g.25645  ORF Transcript_17108/g.25645 Transcript_17108/m.25645 type:complete len:736 (+) Transcript_17108:72-2279(+)